MERLRVTWSKTAIRAFYDEALWYQVNKGGQFVKSFSENIQKTINTVSGMPDIGRLEKEGSRKIYRSVLSHPKCRIYYWHNNHELRVVNLRFTQMNV
ncbi:type II toxin-antitoxin system RelE/ParE family toxin [Bacteroides sp. GD17]|jgi:plasmid stabilization system protein ParE|uniref:type II toxin-antitoxin system RelE/ParE family toxin n=1 Tax=Bacteroides sp. GD17 TaxID=3139826 RepID=UPI0025CD6B28|nr:type II toxin-antitoxin system RelE/ParE family toxin [uncultured Bacteroides sp.]